MTLPHVIHFIFDVCPFSFSWIFVDTLYVDDVMHEVQGVP